MRQLIYGMAIALAVTFSPMLANAGNQKMVESVANMLQASDLAEGCDIGLKYQNNTVWLTGTVPSEAKRVAIEACVFHVKGVDKVVNELEVAEKAAEPEQVASAPIQDGEVQAAGYQRSILRERPMAQRPAMTMPQTTVGMQTANRPTGIPQGAQIISDEVVSVEPMSGLSSPTLPAMATPAPAVGSNYPVNAMMVPSQPITMTPPMQPVNYSMANTAPVQYQTASTPLPMNSPAYATKRHGGPSMRYDQPHLPRHAWPSNASYPNTAAVQYPKRYSAKAWPFIGPFYPYPQVPDGWRKVTLEWHDGYWHVDFDDGSTKGPCHGLFRMTP